MMQYMPNAVFHEPSPLPFLALADDGGGGIPPPSASDQILLNQITTYYHKRYPKSRAAQQLLLRFGLNDPDLVTTFKLGVCDRSLCKRLPNGRTMEGGAVRGHLQRLGILRPSGHELFRGALVVPILDQRGNVLDLFGRRISNDQRPETPMQVSLFDPPRGLFNCRGLVHGKEVILCNGVFDAMTFWVAGLKHVTATLGLKGLTEEFLTGFQQRGVKRVVIAFERTKHADQEARLVAQAFDAVGITCARMDLPRGISVNHYARLKHPIMGTLAELVRNAKPFRQTYATLVEDSICTRAQRPSH